MPLAVRWCHGHSCKPPLVGVTFTKNCRIIARYSCKSHSCHIRSRHSHSHYIHSCHIHSCHTNSCHSHSRKRPLVPRTLMPTSLALHPSVPHPLVPHTHTHTHVEPSMRQSLGAAFACATQSSYTNSCLPLTHLAGMVGTGSDTLVPPTQATHPHAWMHPLTHPRRHGGDRE
jgi:hypothetical protein